MLEKIGKVCQNEGVLGALSFVSAFSSIGLLGAHTIKVFFPAVNPPGVAAVCGLYPFLTLSITTLGPKEAFIQSLSFGIFSAYPLAFFTTNLFTNVSVISPPACLLIGSGILAMGLGVVVISSLIYQSVPHYFL